MPMRTIYSQAQIARTMHVMKIIGDSNNLLILFELMKFGEKSFNELKRMTSINPVTLSKKLSNLKEEGIINSSKCGIENHYFVTDKAMSYKKLLDYIEQLIMEDIEIKKQGRTF
jgi:DNA-binding HxlR family transcriptional regulator